MRPDIEKQLGLCPTLPTVPAVAMEVLRLCQQEDFDMGELGTIIGRDPALSAKILKVANSPMFNLRREVTRVSQAIVWLGVQSVRTLALSFSLARGLRQAKTTGFDQERFWRRSILSAIAARELMRHAGQEAWEEAFLAALLQDIGQMALVQAFGDQYDAVTAESGGDHTRLMDAENHHYGGDHADVGHWLADKWHLPELLKLAMAHSHSVDMAGVEGPPEILDVVRCVALSGWLADIWVSDDPVRATDIAKRRAASLMGLGIAELEPILTSIADAMPEVSELFEIKLGKAEDISAVLDQARETLVMINIQNVQRAQQAEMAVSRLEQRTRQLEETTMRDDLTGLYRRKRLDAFLGHEFDRANFVQKPLSVLFCDIDHFKTINDTFGHQAGDDVLVSIARMLQNEVRTDDLVARYGGEEFVMVLPGVPESQARQVAERVRYRVENTLHAVRTQQTLRATISIGIAIHTPSNHYADCDLLLKAADNALYEAKRQGRNRVVISTGEKTFMCA